MCAWGGDRYGVEDASEPRAPLERAMNANAPSVPWTSGRKTSLCTTFGWRRKGTNQW